MRHEKLAVLRPSYLETLWDVLGRPVSWREGTRLLAASLLSALTSVLLSKVASALLTLFMCLAVIRPSPAWCQNPCICLQWKPRLRGPTCCARLLAADASLPLPPCCRSRDEAGV